VVSTPYPLAAGVLVPHAITMSKAFTKEDSAPDAVVVPPRSPLPPGVPNYVTPRGLELLRAERRALEAARAAIEQAPDESRRGAAFSSWSQRMAELDQRIASAEVVETTQKDVVRFGARVTVADAQGREHDYEIVGVDEADPALGKVAFLSPIAKALLGAAVGDTVNVRKPGGAERLELVAVN
jgi:transcription elongation factor GreB